MFTSATLSSEQHSLIQWPLCDVFISQRTPGHRCLKLFGSEKAANWQDTVTTCRIDGHSNHQHSVCLSARGLIKGELRNKKEAFLRINYLFRASSDSMSKPTFAPHNFVYFLRSFRHCEQWSPQPPHQVQC